MRGRSVGNTLAATLTAVCLSGCRQPAGSDLDHPTADATPGAAHQGRLAIDRLGRKGQLSVSSPDVTSGAAIPGVFSSYGANRKPQITWSSIAGASSYAVIVEDPDAPSPKPFVHDLEWGMTQAGEAGLKGRNDAGVKGWTGPHPPRGDPAHHYHVQVFALDRTPAIKSGADRDALIAALRGHVVADGELVATYKAP